MKIAHRVDHDQINWSSFKYMVFDLPTSKGSYEERYSQLRNNFFYSLKRQTNTPPHTIFLAGTALGDQPHKFISLAPFEVCKDTPHLEKIFQDIMDNGGEGVILRDPECPYQPGRTSGYLKHKASHSPLKIPGITPFLFFLRNTEMRKPELLAQQALSLGNANCKLHLYPLSLVLAGTHIYCR